MNKKSKIVIISLLSIGLASCGSIPETSSFQELSNDSSSNCSSSSSTKSSSTNSSQGSSSLDTSKSPFHVDTSMFDQTNTDTLGLNTIKNAKTIHVFDVSDDANHYVNGVAVTYFKNKFYCQWQTSKNDEDAEDTYVAYSTSDDGIAWNAPKILVATINDGYCSSGGWLVSANLLIAYINVWKDSTSPRGGEAYYIETSDGLTWSSMAPVLMKDGTAMSGIIEQDPHILSTGRIIDAAHFQPGLFANPIYTDDATGRTGWVKATYTNMTTKGGATNSREMEPSEFINSDGNIVMTFRDQNSTFHRLASVSKDKGETWSETVLTDMPDCRQKQSAGNLLDGTAYMVGAPVYNKLRIPLCITLSADGKDFTKSYLLRSQSEIPSLMYTGKAKRLGYHYPKSIVIGGNLYVSYATNKEHVDITIIPLASISLNS